LTTSCAVSCSLYILLLLCVQESADDLVKLYKRVSLDDDLDDQLRSQLLSQLSAGATSTLSTLRLVSSTMIPPVRIGLYSSTVKSCNFVRVFA
jgi:hypothetical protein